jgi:hypothetical protein
VGWGGVGGPRKYLFKHPTLHSCPNVSRQVKEQVSGNFGHPLKVRGEGSLASNEFHVNFM